MSKHHYYISVKNQFNADCTIYCGTNLPKMAKAYAKLEKFRDYGYDIKLDEDMNYDPDCGAFTYYKDIFGKEPETGTNELGFQNCLLEIKREFGKEAD